MNREINFNESNATLRREIRFLMNKERNKYYLNKIKFIPQFGVCLAQQATSQKEWDRDRERKPREWIKGLNQMHTNERI